MPARTAQLLALTLLCAAVWGAAAPQPAFALTDADIAALQTDAPAAAGTKPAATSEPSLGWIVGRTFLSLGAVFALMGGALWLARKYVPQVKQGRSGGIEVLSTRSIGSRRSLMLVRARGKTILLGVTPQAIQTLSEFEDEGGGWNENEWRAGLEPARGASPAAGTTGMERL